MKDNKRTTKQVIAEQQAINRKLWAKENGRLHHVDANKLIAEFMEVVFHDDENQYYNADGLYIGNALQYHTSWDWLMPVVQKIESLGYLFTIQGGKAEYGEMISKTQCFIAEDKLSSTYKAVVEFIKDWPHPPYTDVEGNTYI